jgi:hypothetical protein
MIDDPQTCDVCGEDFNQDRPHMQHPKKETPPTPGQKPKGEEDAKKQA